MNKIEFSNFSRLMSVFLCLILLFSVVVKPMTAYASVAATVAIGAYGIVKVVVSAKVLVALIIGGFTGFLIEPLLNETDYWYENDPVVKNWADQYAGKINGGEVISIPANVQSSIRQKYDVLDTISLSNLYVPYDLVHLENYSAVHIFGADVAAQLEANNLLIQESNSLLLDLKNSIAILPNRVASALSTSLWNIQSSVSSAVSSLHGTTEELRMQLYEHFAPVAHNIEHMRLDFYSHFSLLENILTEELSKLRWNASASLSSVESKIETLIETLTVPNTEVVTQIGTLRTDMTKALSNLEIAVKDLYAIGATTTPNFNNSMNQSNNFADDLKGSVSKGNGQTIHYIGQGKDLISKYRVAFLAVGATLTKFFDIPILADLVTFSLALGIFALVVNLGNTLISKASDSSAKGKRYATAKGG